MKFLRAVGVALVDSWRLAKPYFGSEERWGAFALLGTIIALNLISVYLNVLFSYWYKIFYNALQAKDAAGFWQSIFTYKITTGYPWFVPGFTEIATLNILVGVYALYLQQMLEIRWRRWITENFVGDWLANRAHYSSA